MISQRNDFTALLAEKIMDINYSNLPKETIEKTKLSILDAIGCAVYGSDTPWSKIIVDYVRGLSAGKDSEVFVSNLKTDPASASLANGTMVHSFELDDTFMPGKMHPGAVIIPAAMAVAESTHSKGDLLIEAVVAGYEAMGRVALALDPNAAKERGWHITGICGTFGAAAATGKLIGLDSNQMVSAIGIAGTQSAGLFAFIADGAMTKRLHPGKSSQSGVMAALLAKKGFQGPSKILEAPDGGFLRAFSDRSNPSKLLKETGDKYVIDRTGFKLYSCCGSINPALDAIKNLKEIHGIDLNQIETVSVGVSKTVQDQCGWNYEPLSILQAQMSLKFCVACLVKNNSVFTDQFTEENIRNPELIEYSKKVNVYVDSECNSIYPKKNPARVTIRSKEGSEFTTYVDEPKGLSEEGMVPKEEIFQKFKVLTKSKLEDLKSNQVIEDVMHLDKLDNMNQILRILL